jgi:hypothetical protein
MNENNLKTLKKLILNKKILIFLKTRVDPCF